MVTSELMLLALVVKECVVVVSVVKGSQIQKGSKVIRCEPVRTGEVA